MLSKKTLRTKKSQLFLKKLQTFCGFKCGILIIFILFCNMYCLSTIAQNEMQYSGFVNTPTITNPGSVGGAGSVRALGSYRTQWVGFKDAPQTTVLGIDSEVKFWKSFHGVGALVVYDQIGAYTNMFINANYSYHIELDKGLLGLGMRVGAINVAFDASDLKTTVSGMEDDYHQETDDVLEESDDSGTAFDVGLGAFFQSKKSILSLSILHLSAPTIEMKSGAKVTCKPLLVFNASRQIVQKTLWRADAMLTTKTDFATYQIEASFAALVKEKVSFGMGCRLQDAIFFQVGVNLSNGLCVGYNYDLCTTKLFKYNTGTHEVIATYTFDVNVEKRTKRYKSVRIL